MSCDNILLSPANLAQALSLQVGPRHDLQNSNSLEVRMTKMKPHVKTVQHVICSADEPSSHPLKSVQIA